MAESTGSLETSNQQESDGASVSSNAAVKTAVKQAIEPAPKVRSLAELFGDEEGNPLSENDGAEIDDDPSKPAASIDAAAKRLKMTAEDVYAIKVPMPNGAEAVTIGDLKDRVGELVDLESRELAFDQRRQKSEGELMRAQQEMRELMAAVPKEHLTPALLDKARRRHDATMNMERERTLEFIPAWNDERKMEVDKTGMRTFMAEYGFDDTFLDTIVDHRALKFVRDMWLRDVRIKKALADVKVPVRKGQRPSGKLGKAPVKPAATTRRQPVQDQRGKIMSFLDSSNED